MVYPTTSVIQGTLPLWGEIVLGSPFLPQNSLPFFLSCVFFGPLCFPPKPAKIIRFASRLFRWFFGAGPLFPPTRPTKKRFPRSVAQFKWYHRPGALPEAWTSSRPAASWEPGASETRERARESERGWTCALGVAEVGFYGVFFRFFFFFAFLPRRGSC